jgi:integrase
MERATMSELPRGITRFSYKLKDGTTVEKLRVQIKRKGLNINKVFNLDQLQEAIELVNTTRSVTGTEQILLIQQQQKKQQEIIRDYITKPPFSYFANEYIKHYLNQIFDGTDLTKRNLHAKQSLIKVLINTPIDIVDDFKDGAILTQLKTKKTINFGDLKPDEIKPYHINLLLKYHIALGKKSSTLTAYISAFNNIFKKIRHIDPSYENLSNPTLNYDKDLLKVNRGEKIEFRLTEEQREELLKHLENYKNRDFERIIKIALFTAMRYSEVFYLRKNQIDLENEIINLPKTKTGKRKVYLTRECSEFIKTFIDDVKDELFTSYTFSGFKKSFTGFVDRYLSFNLKLHFLRKEAISHFVEKANTDNSLLIAEILGFGVRTIEKRLNEFEKPNISSQKGVLKSIGHTSPNITQKHYFSLKKGR